MSRRFVSKLKLLPDEATNIKKNEYFIIFCSGRLAQRESAAFTRQRSLVQSQYRPPFSTQVKSDFAWLTVEYSSNFLPELPHFQ